MISEGKTVDIELDPGDNVLFNNLLFHRGQDYHSGMIPWTPDFRYQDAPQPTLPQLQVYLYTGIIILIKSFQRVRIAIHALGRIFGPKGN